MINNISMITTILLVIGGIMIVLLVILAGIYINMKIRENQESKPKKEVLPNSDDKKSEKNKMKQYTIVSVFDFMEFDKIEDNMIITKNGNKYIMIIDCQGVNYDLMSQEEKISVEEGFIQFLNTLTSPVQIYTQTRKINMENSLQNYKAKVNDIEMAYNRQKLRYDQLVKNPNVSQEILKKEYVELIKQKNLCEYGKDIIYNTERMSLNKNILSKKYYVAIAYYASDTGEGNLSKDEIREVAFSDLYTRSQALIRSLSISGVVGRIMSSTDLADLLYVAYNRDDADIYGVDKAIKARYDELYSTAPDYMEKKIKILDDEIQKEAYNRANEKVLKARTENEKKYDEKVNNLDDIINNLASLIIEENAQTIGRDVADKAKEDISKDKKRRERRLNVQEKTSQGRSSNRA